MCIGEFRKMSIDNDKWNENIRLRQNLDEIFKIHRNNQISIRNLKSGNFGLFQKFEKCMFKLYRQIRIQSPAANRLFLYLVEVCLGYAEDPRDSLNFNVKRIMKECNISTRKSLYDSINYLRERNIVFFTESDSGKSIKINTSILLWKLNDDEDERRMKIYEREKDRLIEYYRNNNRNGNRG